MAASAEVVLLQLAGVFVIAKLAGFIVGAFRVTPLVGEILAGVAIANTQLAGWIHLGADTEVLAVFAELGVIFLIFTVGLETNLASLAKVGRTSIQAALLGILFPFLGGAGLLWLLGYSTSAALFMGTAMVATSVGITARVLADAGQLGSLTARVILGAAVIDDVLGLLMLTIISSVIIAGTVSAAEIGVILATTAAFFVVSFLIGRGVLRMTSPPVEAKRRHAWAAFMGRKDFPVILALGLCLTLSALAVEFGLAAIIGAFVAGLLFETASDDHDLEHRLEAVTQLLAPFFFVFIGISLDLSTMTTSFWLIVAVTALALATKIVGCGLGALDRGKEVALAVGIGMSPRGEVGIIVALLGLNLGIVGAEIYGVVVAMSVLTTLIAPPLLVWAIRRIPGEGALVSGGTAPTGEPATDPAS